MATDTTVEDLFDGDDEEKRKKKLIQNILRLLEKGGYAAAPSDLVKDWKPGDPGILMEKVTTEFNEDSWTFYKPVKREYYFDSVEEAQDTRCTRCGAWHSEAQACITVDELRGK